MGLIENKQILNIECKVFATKLKCSLDCELDREMLNELYILVQ